MENAIFQAELHGRTKLAEDALEFIETEILPTVDANNFENESNIDPLFTRLRAHRLRAFTLLHFGLRPIAGQGETGGQESFEIWQELEARARAAGKGLARPIDEPLYFKVMPMIYDIIGDRKAGVAQARIQELERVAQSLWADYDASTLPNVWHGRIMLSKFVANFYTALAEIDQDRFEKHVLRWVRLGVASVPVHCEHNLKNIFFP